MDQEVARVEWERHPYPIPSVGDSGVTPAEPPIAGPTGGFPGSGHSGGGIPPTPEVSGGAGSGPSGADEPPFPGVSGGGSGPSSVGRPPFSGVSGGIGSEPSGVGVPPLSDVPGIGGSGPSGVGVPPFPVGNGTGPSGVQTPPYPTSSAGGSKSGNAKCNNGFGSDINNIGCDVCGNGGCKSEAQYCCFVNNNGHSDPVCSKYSFPHSGGSCPESPTQVPPTGGSGANLPPPQATASSGADSSIPSYRPPAKLPSDIPPGVEEQPANDTLSEGSLGEVQCNADHTSVQSMTADVSIP